LKRSNILPETVLKLWALAAGRCEFLGCNEPLWRDGLTLQEANLSHIAHIIAASPNGPRGDRIESKKMERDFSNLILVCSKHHKLIDNKKLVKKYSVGLLRDFKRLHEERISIQTSIQENMATTILIFKANIGDCMVEIPFDQICQAIYPKYPSDDKGIELDFTKHSGEGDKHFWNSFKDEISSQIKLNLRKSKINNLSVFALAPIPLLIQLGKCLGNKISSDIYQRHRDAQDWIWKKNTAGKSFRYIVKKRCINSKNKKIVLILSLSGKIHHNEIKDLIGKKVARYEITIERPSPNFLKTRKHLLKFKEIYRNLISEIRSKHGPKCQIHLFPAIPAPIAVLCGQELLPKSDPQLYIYDYNKEKNGFRFIFNIN